MELKREETEFGLTFEMIWPFRVHFGQKRQQNLELLHARKYRALGLLPDPIDFLNFVAVAVPVSF